MRRFINEEYQQQFDNDAHFKEKVMQSEKEYCRYLSVADTTEGSSNVNDSILEKFTTADNRSVYFWYGFLQPTPNKFKGNLTISLIKNFRPDLEEKFIFVYFNNQTPSSEYYFEFKKIFSLIPLSIIERMSAFILVKPYFYIKAYDYVGLGAINRHCAKHYSTVENCQQLIDRLKIPLHDFVLFVPDAISEEFPATIKRRPSLVNYRINLQGQNMTEEELKDRHDFELSIKALITKQIYKLENYELGELGIPIIIQLLICYFKEKPEGLSEQGIFRKSVSLDEENETLAELSKRNYEYLQHIKNPHLIASLIKKFFNNLKEPIIPFAAFKTLMHDQGVSNKKEYIKGIIKTLPSLNFLTLLFLIDFLRKDVIPKELSSKMSAHNLAIVFSPSLMRSQVPSMADLVYASKSVGVTAILISEFEDIFGGEHQRKNLFKKSMIIHNASFKKGIRDELNIEERASESDFQTHPFSEISYQETEKREEPQVRKVEAGGKKVQTTRSDIKPTSAELAQKQVSKSSFLHDYSKEEEFFQIDQEAETLQEDILHGKPKSHKVFATSQPHHGDSHEELEGKAVRKEGGKVVEGCSLSSPAQKGSVNRSTIFNLGEEKTGERP